MVEKKTPSVKKSTKKETTSEKVSKKRTTNTRTPKSLVLEVANPENLKIEQEICNDKYLCQKKHKCCGKVIHTIKLLLLLANFIILLILLWKINGINKQNILGNGGKENYEALLKLYQTDNYKKYVNDQIINLEATLESYNDSSIDSKN